MEHCVVSGNASCTSCDREMAMLEVTKPESTLPSTIRFEVCFILNFKHGMAKPTLRLIHSHNGPDDLLFRANALLATGNAEEALRLYTRILYGVSPGHVCAFLNRSLAYLALGYPELAVTDAYRAAVVTHSIRATRRSSTEEQEVKKAVLKYLRAEDLHLQSEEPWTLEPSCYIGTGWLSAPLASVLLAPPPDISVEKTLTWNALELRAIFRMSGALWACGGGALSDALGLVEDTLRVRPKGPQYTLTRFEKDAFLTLGNQISWSMTCSFSEHGEDETIWMMKTKAAVVNRVLYPWNKKAPDMAKYVNVQELEAYADDAAKSCTVRSTPATMDAGASLRLIAARDIFAGETVLSEGSLLQVTTAPNTLFGDFYCDTCAAILVMPQKARDLFLSKLSSDNKHSQSQRSSVEGQLAVRELDEDLLSHSPSLSRPPTPPPHWQRSQSPALEEDLGELSQRLKDKPDFRHCKNCCEVIFCSRDCFEFSNDYHDSLCKTGVEADIHTSHINGSIIMNRDRMKSESEELLVHPKARCLYDRVLVRVFSLAMDQNVHPLDLPELRWLNGDLRRPYSDKRHENDGDPPLYPSSPTSVDVDHTKALPWTFTNNVVLPLRWLKDLGVGPFERLDSYDGWVINTLYAKIMHSMRITKGARHAKIYDEKGRLIREETPAPEPVSETVWVGTIHNVFSMIGIADKNKGSRPNVTVDEDENVKCFAVSSEAASAEAEAQSNKSPDMDVDPNLSPFSPSLNKVCIRVGEDILRLAAPNVLSELGLGRSGDSTESRAGDVREMNVNRSFGDIPR